MKKSHCCSPRRFGLSACAEEVHTVDITVDPIFAKDGTVVDYRPTVMSPAEED